MKKAVAIFDGYIAGTSKNIQKLEDDMNELISDNRVFVYNIQYQVTSNDYGNLVHSAMVFYKWE